VGVRVRQRFRSHDSTPSRRGRPAGLWLLVPHRVEAGPRPGRTGVDPRRGRDDRAAGEVHPRRHRHLARRRGHPDPGPSRALRGGESGHPGPGGPTHLRRRGHPRRDGEGSDPHEPVADRLVGVVVRRERAATVRGVQGRHGRERGAVHRPLSVAARRRVGRGRNGYYRCIFDYFPPQNSNATVTKQFCKGSTPQSPESVCPDYSADAALDYFDACMATYGDPDYCGQFVSSIPWQPADPCTTGN
jgi:hypothetical protein